MQPALKRQPKPAADASVATTNIRVIPMSQLVSNPDQPRQHWDDEKDEDGKTPLARLAESVKAQGVLQPLVVTNWDNDMYLVVCGGRRYRAAKMAGVKEVPCVIKPGLTGDQILEISVIENLQREDLTPIDEAHAIDALMKRCGWTQTAVGKKLGISVAAVNYKLSLLKLPAELQTEVKKGRLSETQGRTIAQAVGKAPEGKREAVMKEVHDKVAKARQSGAKVDTKAVATIARTVVDKHAKPAASTPQAKGRKGKAPEKPKVQPPTPKEKTQAKAFAKAVSGAVKAMRGFAAALAERPARERFAMVVLAAQPDAVDAAKAVHDFLGKLLAEVAEVKRQRMVAKLG